MAQRLLWLTFGVILGFGLFFLTKTTLFPSPSFHKAAQKAAPAVVNIFTSKDQQITIEEHHNYSQQRKFHRLNKHQEFSLGSGVILDHKGYIATNYHVIEAANTITVMLYDGRQSSVQIIHVDPYTDIALLKINLPSLHPIQLGSSVKARVGDPVLAIGNPYGFSQSVTAGILSAKGRYGIKKDMLENYLQTDASINAGSSGGALVNMHGELIGLNTSIFSSGKGFSGVGLAIPVELIRKIYEDIRQSGEVVPTWIGIKMAALSQGNPDAIAEIQHVFPQSPAHRAGIKPGDIITHINRRPLSSLHNETKQIAQSRKGDIVTLQLLRKQNPLLFKIKIENKPTSNALDAYY